LSQNKKEGGFGQLLILSMGARAAAQAFCFFISILLLRIIPLEAYGLITFYMSMYHIIVVLTVHGISQAYLRNSHDPRGDSSTLLYTVSFFGLLGLLIYTLLPFFNITLGTQLKWETETNIMIGSMFILVPLRATLTTLAQAEKRMDALIKYQIAINVIAAILAYLLARKGLGPIALVSRQLSTELFLILVYAFVLRWKPSLKFNLSFAKALYKDAMALSTNRTCQILVQRSARLIVFYVYGVVIAGLYDIVCRLLFQIYNIIGQIQGQLLPSYIRNIKSKTHHESYLQIYRSSIDIMAIFIFPVLLFVMIYPVEVLDLYTKKNFLEHAATIRVITLVTLIVAIQGSDQFFISQLAPKRKIVKISLITFLCSLATLALSPLIGLPAVAFADGSYDIFNFISYRKFMGEKIGLSISDQLLPLLPLPIIGIPLFLIRDSALNYFYSLLEAPKVVLMIIFLTAVASINLALIFIIKKVFSHKLSKG